MKKLLAVAVLVAGLGATAGCSSSSDSTAEPSTTAATVSAVAAPATTTTPPLHRWVGSGVFSVGEHPSGGARASIPVGRYTVELQDDRTFGVWYLCSSLPCSPSSGNTTSSGEASGEGFSMVIDILPTDGAIYGDGVNFVETR